MKQGTLLSAARLAVRTLALAALGEAIFQILWHMTKGGFAYPLFMYAGLTSVLLPVIAFAPDIHRENGSPRTRSILSVMALLLVVVCINMTLVSATNGGRWDIAGMSLLIVPGWFIMICGILAFDDRLKRRKTKRANGS